MLHVLMHVKVRHLKKTLCFILKEPICQANFGAIGCTNSPLKNPSLSFHGVCDEWLQY